MLNHQLGMLKTAPPPVDKTIGRSDFAKNLPKHLSEVSDFCESHNLPLAWGMSHFSPPTKESPLDCLLDVMNQRELYTEPTRWEPAATMASLFDDSEVNFSLGVAFLQECFHANVAADTIYSPVHSQYLRLKHTPYAEMAISTRAILNDAFDPETIGMLEKEKDFTLRVMLSQVIARRQPIRGSQYLAPTLDTPEDTKLRPVDAAADLPLYKMDVGETPVRTKEIGYALQLGYSLMRSSDVTIDAIAWVQRIKALQTEDALINAAIDVVGGKAKAHAFPAEPTKKDLIKLHLQPDGIVTLNTIGGTLDAVAEYAAVDLTFTSSNQAPMAAGRRTWLDDLMGIETIFKRDPDEVSELKVSGDKPVMIVWFKEFGVVYIVERNGSIAETQRNPLARNIVLTNSHNFAFHPMEECATSSWKVTLG